MKTFRAKLIISYLLLLGMFAAGFTIALIVIQDVGERTARLADEYWETDDLIADSRILLGQISQLLMAEPRSGDEERIRHLRPELAALPERILATHLRPETRRKLADRLQQLADALAGDLHDPQRRAALLADLRELDHNLEDRTARFSERVVRPEQERIQELLAGIKGVLTATAIVSVLLAALAAILLARSISLPITRIARMIRQMEKGDLGVRLELAATDEIGDLGRALDGLAATLEQTVGELAESIARHQGTEAELREQSARLRQLEQIVRNSPAVAFRCRAEAGWPFEFVSDNIDQFGFDPRSLIGGERRFASLLPAEDRGKAAAALAGATDSATLEHRLLTAGGEYRWVDSRFWLQRDERGQLAGFEGILLDITETMRLREQTVRASRLASLGELAAGVAHEINNPNALILLNASILADACAAAIPVLDRKLAEDGDFPLGRLPYSRLRQELPRLAAGILDSAGRIRRIVEDLKDFVRSGGEREETPVDLNEVAQTACRLAENVLKKSTARFEISLQPELPPVSGSPQRLTQVVVNLLMNACQALPDPSRGIFLGTRAEPESGKIIVEVRDQGEGIAPEHLTHLTDPFFTTRRESGGTGLGLSVSARIVREHGGSLEFASEPGRGATVILRLPIRQERAA